ncbi:MAG: amino acid adenylation domain-containing protein, partial [Acidobacteria bacterium]|nr:amino acid adenylation domain-containing protein [Acidobacteriota bacterium]
WSIGVLVNELRAMLEGAELPPLPIQYVDYSVWQRRWLEEEGRLEGQLAYWQQQLAGLPESLDLPTDFSRPAMQSFVGATRTFALDAQLTAQLKRVAERQGATLYMVLLAAFDVLLHRYSGQDDLCVGSPIANRQYGQTDSLIGMFVNTLAMRSQLAANDTLASFLEKVKTTCLDAFEHQDAPFERLVEAVRPHRNLAISPLFQVMLILQNVDMGRPDERIRLYPVDTGISKFDLTLALTETADGLTAAVEYSTALYEPATVDRMVEHFAAICRAFGDHADLRIRDLDFLGEGEKQRLLFDFNATRADYPTGGCLHELFTAKVADRADAIAVVCGDARLTYGELDAKSATLALHLQSHGVQPDQLVGLCLERSLDMIVGMLGILRAGGAYVPLDPNYPGERLAYMVRDSRAAIVLTEASLQDKLTTLFPEGTHVIALDSEWTQIAEHAATLQSAGVTLKQKVTPRHLSHVIYTSGSTGQPKGVAIEHHSPVTLVHWATEVYDRAELSEVLASTSICFDLSVYEIFVTLANGGTIVLVPNALGLASLPPAQGITLINTVPSAAEELVRLEAIPESVRTINLAGEPLSRVLVDKLYETTNVEKVYDLYGPSEDTTYSTFTLRVKDARPTIGRPIANTQVYILDRHGRVQPIGVPGELHIAGDGLAREYLHRPELTSEKFIANPFEAGTRMYRTGDLARWLDDGTIQYLGRIDTQVKVRGFRIEMGEIEARLAEHPAIQDAAVIARGEGASKELIAFYRARDLSAEELPKEELRAYLLRTLPEYMVPAAFVSLVAIPLSPNGKIDRRALSRMDVTTTAVAGSSYVAPRTEAERRTVAVWAEVLGRDPETIGIHDDFFEAGGHSLLGTRLISRLRSEFDADLPLKTLFESTTVAQLAEAIATARKSDVPPIVPFDRSQYESLPLSFSQERLWFINQLEPNSAAYNVPAAVVIEGELDVDRLKAAFDVVIERHENLRTVFVNRDGRSQQQILNRVEIALDLTDLTHIADTDARAEEAQRLCRADVAKPFDLATGPLVRGKVIRLGEHEHLLMLNMHHIISDGWSIGVLIRELGAILNGATLPALPIQYADYALWQREWLEGSGVLEQQLGYWRTRLAGVSESLNLPTDHPRPSVQNPAGADYAFTLDAELTAGLERVAEERGATLYMVLLAAFQTLLHRYSGQDDICVGSPIANRQYGETEALIGMFVNTLALRTQVQGDDVFADLLARVKTTCLEAYEHQDAPFEKVVDALQLRRDLASTPLFQVMLVLQNEDLGFVPDSRIRPFPLESGISKFDLTLDLMETPDGLAATLQYRTVLFERTTIARMAEHFAAVCRAIAATPSARVGELAMLGDAEKQHLLRGLNDTRVDYRTDQCLHELFLAQVDAFADNVAVISGDERLTYRQLHERARSLALYLQSEGVQPDSLVGVCMERSLKMVIALYGILLAGGAYVPLDPDYPEDRLRHMVEDCGATIVLTQEALRAKLATFVSEDTRVITQWPAHLDGTLAKNVTPSNLAYVIFTSGSTGRPKGVMNEHRGIVNRLLWMQDAYQLDATDAVLQKTPYSFDVSVWELFWPLFTGATLVMAKPEGHKDPAYLVDTIQQQQITTLHFVPSMLQVFLEHDAASQCASLKRVVCSGEALPSVLVRRFAERLPHATLYNLYGPTEAAVDVTAWTCPKTDIPNAIPIGKPIANTQMY